MCPEHISAPVTRTTIIRWEATNLTSDVKRRARLHHPSNAVWDTAPRARTTWHSTYFRWIPIGWIRIVGRFGYTACRSFIGVCVVFGFEFGDHVFNDEIVGYYSRGVLSVLDGADVVHHCSSVDRRNKWWIWTPSLIIIYFFGLPKRSGLMKQALSIRMYQHQ